MSDDVVLASSINKLFTLLDACVSSLRRGHADIICIVPSLTYDPRRESRMSDDVVIVRRVSFVVCLCMYRVLCCVMLC